MNINEIEIVDTFPIDGVLSVVIGKRDNAPFPDKPFSTHLMGKDDEGKFHLVAGHYDLRYLHADFDAQNRVNLYRG